MKSYNRITCTVLGGALALALLALASTAMAADAKSKAKKAEPKIIPYTLKFCIVSGDKLGEMGKPVVITNDNREIKFCCKDCIKDFKKDPAKWVKKIDEAEAKAKAAEKK